MMDINNLNKLNPANSANDIYSSSQGEIRQNLLKNIGVNFLKKNMPISTHNSIKFTSGSDNVGNNSGTS